MEIDKDLIVLIPTKGRQNYLNRVAYYYSHFNFDVYILDAYNTPYKIDEYDNIHYRWDPSQGFHEELLKLAESTSASYILLAADDDFVKYETLIQCYGKMRSDSTLSLGTGRQITFDEEFDGFFKSYYSANQASSLGKSILKISDASNFFYHHQGIVYSLYTRQYFIDCMKTIYDAKIELGRFQELIHGIESFRHGNMFFCDEFLNFRECSKSEHWSRNTPLIRFRNLIKEKSLRNDFLRLYRYYDMKDFLFALKCIFVKMWSDSSINRIKRSMSMPQPAPQYEVVNDEEMKCKIFEAINHMTN